MIRDFALPDLGEGLTESEIVSWKISEGETIALNQIIADVETAKAVVQLPTPWAGVVTKLLHEEGATVEVGAPILSIDVGGDAPGDASDDAGSVESDGSGSGSDGSGAKREPTLVGYGAPAADGKRPTRRARAGAHAAAATQAGEVDARADDQPEVQPHADEAPAQQAQQADQNAPAQSAGETETQQTVPMSTPPVRKLARDKGIDLSTLTGTGPAGLITRQDVQAAIDGGGAQASQPVGEAPGQPAPSSASQTSTALSDPGAREERIPIKGVRKHTAAAMVSSAFTAPHVSEFLTVDVTGSMDLLRQLKADRSYSDVRPTFTAIVAKAVLIALARHPELNSRWDEAAGEIVRPRYVNLGIAAATERGLIVPNIKDAEGMDLRSLCAALGALTGAARDGVTSPKDLTGGTFTISNVGVFGVDAGTPILNPGEAGILATGQVRRTPWEHEGQIALREVMTLSLSFDHRLVDGQAGSLFLADIGKILAHPGATLALL